MKVYEKVYDYFVNQIQKKSLKSGDKMPSLRETEKLLGVSRTSVETAYLQLSADGYIYSVEKVGYFISDTVDSVAIIKPEEKEIKKQTEKIYKYDLSTIGEDKEVSCLQLWRRYMKSALRQEDRLLSYGDNQGEKDLREEICKHIRKTRNIICSADEVVIGAGFQNLLQILVALIPGEKTISFPTKDFADGATTFKNAGFQVSYRNKESHVIYVTPQYMTLWGDVMPMKRRRELVEHAKVNNHLLIEDDYQNEFVFSQKPTPSLYALNGGENTAFLGSFSRVLLPSVRISYLVLPKGIKEDYLKIKDLYNQTASKAEQIALTQFLRDGHLNRHIKKMKRFYQDKRSLMEQEIEKAFSSKAEIMIGDSGMEFGLRFKNYDKKKLHENSQVKTTILDEKDNELLLLLSCSKIPENEIHEAINSLSDVII
ncbi:MocR-like pyridoxine biosynthesis transcription factor PdxR [Pseudobutyrivibrio sp.]|uniref:MocR-like pyridoxine biosynthesis transcription factor PdxR n=1 Tax=Pseudobutyrivibrio sp. TaxID=2014367 RepID=UPI001D6B8502|nr:PLP-dependent aminotransferase family protein [Pseudobutyrivibrio sp.]MBE5911723.1 PLP-dependent aminotransferase family protein [Pseudobutyrivibrio sp.]